jgi:hypothetical protein
VSVEKLADQIATADAISVDKKPNKSFEFVRGA